MQLNEFPELTNLSDNDLLIVQDAKTLALRSIKAATLKQYVGGSGGGSTGNIRDEILKDAPLNYWQFDEVEGNIAIDLGSAKKNGMYTAVTLAKPKLANGSLYSAFFTDVNSVVNFSNSILNNNTNVTIELVINLVSASVRGLFISLGTNFEIGLGIGGGGDTNSNGNYLIGIAGNVVWRSSYKNIGIGTHHVVMVYQGATNREWLFFIDGFLVATLGAATPNIPNNIGFIRGLDSGQVTIDEVVIYNKALSPNRILNHANTVIY